MAVPTQDGKRQLMVPGGRFMTETGHPKHYFLIQRLMLYIKTRLIPLKPITNNQLRHLKI